MNICMPVMLFESESSTADMHHIINPQTLKALLLWHCLSDLQKDLILVGFVRGLHVRICDMHSEYALCAHVPCQSWAQENYDNIARPHPSHSHQLHHRCVTLCKFSTSKWFLELQGHHKMWICFQQIGMGRKLKGDVVWRDQCSHDIYTGELTKSTCPHLSDKVYDITARYKVY